MTNHNTDHVLDAIDSALGDALSPDAMRWTPHIPEVPNETVSWERFTITTAEENTSDR